MMVPSWLKPGIRLERKEEPQSQSGRPSKVSRAIDSQRPTPICTTSHEVQRRLRGIHFGEREQVVAGKWSVKLDIRQAVDSWREDRKMVWTAGGKARYIEVFP